MACAAACAAASCFIDEEPKVEFAGIILCAAFTDAATVFLNYSIRCYLNLLTPLRQSKTLTTWFTQQMTGTWKSSDRVSRLVRKSSRPHVTFVHATTDSIILRTETDRLFYLVVNALEDENLSALVIEK